jgi:fibro-slime domain-containing protein
MAKSSYSAPLAAMLCTALLFSCAPEVEPLPSPQSTSYCVYPETRQCFSTSQTTCIDGGTWNDFCPYSSSGNISSSNISSSSKQLSSSTTQQGGEKQFGLDIVIRDFKMGAFGSFEPENCNAATKCNYSGGTYGATTGMVQTALFYDKINCPKDDIMGKAGDPDYLRYRYCVYPLPADPPPSIMCYGESVDKWYVDSEEAKTFHEILTLTCSNDGLCEVDSGSKGYFPLDDKQGTWGNDNTCTGGSGHNFGFSVTGSTEFKYVSANNADNFAFSGDDDMWVFVDGELVIDLGGIHGRIAGSFRVDSLAKARGWADNSRHSINFFYAERRVTQSNLKLTLRLTDLSTPR